MAQLLAAQPEGGALDPQGPVSEALSRQGEFDAGNIDE